MSTPDDIASPGKPRRRSRLFQAAPNRLLVDEWVPNIKLPPPPTTALEEDEGPSARLDEHGLPVREPEEEEPEPERRGPARIYVGQGAPTSGTEPAPALPELQGPEMPDLRLPFSAAGSGVDDDEEASSGDLPDLSIDGSGGGWDSMGLGHKQRSDSDLEAPTDPNLRAQADQPKAPAIAMPAAEEQSAPKPTPQPKSAPAARSPSWTRPAPSADRAARATPESPPRIRAAAPPRPEPGLASFVPRSLIIAIVVLGLVALAVWAVRGSSLKQSGSQAPASSSSAPADGPTTVDGLFIHPAKLSAEPAPPRDPEPAPQPAAPEPAAEPPAAAEPTAAEPAASEPTAAKPKPAAAKPAASTPKPAAAKLPATEPAAKPAAAEPAVSEPPVAEPGGKGFMVVESDRYAMIYMGGRRLGGTPVARMELEPGTYAIRAVCRDTGASQTRQIEVKPDELTTASFKFLP